MEDINPLDISKEAKERGKEICDSIFYAWFHILKGNKDAWVATVYNAHKIIDDLIENNRHLKEFNIIYWYQVKFSIKLFNW